MIAVSIFASTSLDPLVPLLNDLGLDTALLDDPRLDLVPTLLGVVLRVFPAADSSTTWAPHRETSLDNIFSLQPRPSCDTRCWLPKLHAKGTLFVLQVRASPGWAKFAG